MVRLSERKTKFIWVFPLSEPPKQRHRSPTPSIASKQVWVTPMVHVWLTPMVGVWLTPVLRHWKPPFLSTSGKHPEAPPSAPHRQRRKRPKPDAKTTFSTHSSAPRPVRIVKMTKINRKAWKKSLLFVLFVCIISLFYHFLLKSVGGYKKTSYLCTVIQHGGDSENLRMTQQKE